MKVLMHYTTNNHVFNCFSQVGTNDFTNQDRIQHIKDFFTKFHRTQYHLYFVVSHFDIGSHATKYTACNIDYDSTDETFNYTKVSEYTKNLICDELGLKSTNTYDSESFYRVFTIPGSESDFFNNNDKTELNKIRMKFYTWDELLESKNILFDQINGLIFNRDNVLKVASTYVPKINYTNKHKNKKYFDALKSIGFISDELNTSHTTLHGDIGEFVMHIMLSQFLRDESLERYIYPKLVLKTSPKMAVYGNDGTIYLKDKKEIFYLEAKFYSDLKSAIDKAVDSLQDHNEVDQEHLSHRIEMFRNIKTDELSEIIEIDENVKENLAMFLICDNLTNYDEIIEVVKSNTKLNTIKSKFNIILFVLPILSKKEYLDFFALKSNKVLEELSAN